MRHGSHKMTTLILANKDDNAILEPSAPVVRCALVNKLYCTNVSCEWVSCLHPESFICRLHAFFHIVARFPLTIHHTSQYSEFVFTREFDAGSRGAQNHVHLLFRSAWCLSTTDSLARVPNPPSPLLQ